MLTQNKSGQIINPVKSEDIYPSGSSVSTTITLTNSATAYSIPSGTAPTDRYVLIIHNGSDTNIYFGYATLTTGGILLSSGSNVTINLGANQVVYAYCGSSGKVLNYTYKLIG